MDILTLSNFLDPLQCNSPNAPEEGYVHTSTLPVTPASFDYQSKEEHGIRSRQVAEDKTAKGISVGIHTVDRPEPKYQICFKREVGKREIFMEKSSTSSDCSHIVVKAHFPGEKIADLELKVESNHLLVESPKRQVILIYLEVS